MTEEEAYARGHTPATRAALSERDIYVLKQDVARIDKALRVVEKATDASKNQVKGISISVLVIWSIVNVVISVVSAYALLRGVK